MPTDAEDADRAAAGVRVLEGVVELLDDLFDFIRGKGQQTRVDGVGLLVGLVGEAGHDAEVVSGPAEAPEEVGVFGRGCCHDLSVGQDDRCRQEIVDGETVLATQPAISAAQGKAANACMVDGASHGGQPVLGSGLVDFLPGGAPADRNSFGSWVHGDGFHEGQVYDQATVGGAGASDRVASTFDGEVDMMLLSPEESGADILGISRHGHNSLLSTVRMILVWT
ncbi:hypothetical protein CNMCM6936_004132 [Aspergillus lentulus]|nr:hypothetical protein CNMCM6936_004132 [Aspergillus lentulus]